MASPEVSIQASALVLIGEVLGQFANCLVLLEALRGAPCGLPNTEMQSLAYPLLLIRGTR